MVGRCAQAAEASDVETACGLLFTVGGIVGFAETCSYGGGQRPINQVFAWFTLTGVAVTTLGLLWGVAEFVLSAVRRFKDRGI